MIQNDDEVHYLNIITLLKQLPKVIAPLNFESDLMRRINSGNFQKNYRSRWWDKLFLPSRIIPAAAFALSILVVFWRNPKLEKQYQKLRSLAHLK